MSTDDSQTRTKRICIDLEAGDAGPSSTVAGPGPHCVRAAASKYFAANLSAYKWDQHYTATDPIARQHELRSDRLCGLLIIRCGDYRVEPDHLQLAQGPEYVTSATVQAHAVNPAEFQAVIQARVARVI